MTRKAPEKTIAYAVLEHIRQNPGVTSLNITADLNIPQGTSTSALCSLVERGLVDRQKIPNSNGTYAYFIAQRSSEAKPTSTIEDCNAYIATLEHRLTMLEQEVAELEAWKAAAITAHPDLVPVDPLLLKAREICARQAMRNGNSDRAADYIEGRLDTVGTMQAVLEALQMPVEGPANA